MVFITTSPTKLTTKTCVAIQLQPHEGMLFLFGCSDKGKYWRARLKKLRRQRHTLIKNVVSWIFKKNCAARVARFSEQFCAWPLSAKQEREIPSFEVLTIMQVTIRLCYKDINHKNYNFLNCDWFKKLLFPTNSLTKLLSDSLLSDSLLSDSSTNQSHSKL